eukprot:CAMPEP_0119343916 /NCGR_PEP_ID=MMETSP1333-20130426/106702_1 /TAXON_ID=418940 /ORGANISM="Scyphosphaera apsteinii, Strain RCC1455" /LENGTH=90 /DNA_ID=CAMNT_0007356337 /DNA_START=469 /DNA_END=741 /DNA_ORIENTATION=-
MGIEDLVGWHDISKPKIGDLQQAAAREQHILGLQVAMGNADRVAVLRPKQRWPKNHSCWLGVGRCCWLKNAMYAGTARTTMSQYAAGKPC